ncbi:MAG: hypothetical protein KDA86_27890, partial [Planctomycetaceae bacterium]|nr:hypothetical protein [Planctomycetaceae bacterium]
IQLGLVGRGGQGGVLAEKVRAVGVFHARQIGARRSWRKRAKKAGAPEDAGPIAARRRGRQTLQSSTAFLA